MVQGVGFGVGSTGCGGLTLSGCHHSSAHSRKFATATACTKPDWMQMAQQQQNATKVGTRVFYARHLVLEPHMYRNITLAAGSHAPGPNKWQPTQANNHNQVKPSSVKSCAMPQSTTRMMESRNTFFTAFLAHSSFKQSANCTHQQLLQTQAKTALLHRFKKLAASSLGSLNHREEENG